MLWFAQPDSEPGGRAVRVVRPPPDRPDALPQLTLQELFQRLGWFVSIRWFAGLAALLLVTIGWYGFDVRVPPRPVVLTIATVFSYNALFLLLVTDAYRRHQVSARFISGCANAQIICDMVALAFLMHFTGGVENAFIVFFVCPLVIASELLPNRIAYMHALLGAVLIHLVAWLECAGVLPHVAVGQAPGAETYKNPVVVAKFTVALSLLGFATVFLAGGSVRVRMTLAGDHVSLAVSDTGIGIPPTALPRIFEEFYRAENAKQVFRSGTGMGLPIVKRLVETHGGALAVSSTPGQGTTFTVTLPAVD